MVSTASPAIVQKKSNAPAASNQRSLGCHGSDADISHPGILGFSSGYRNGALGRRRNLHGEDANPPIACQTAYEKSAAATLKRARTPEWKSTRRAIGLAPQFAVFERVQRGVEFGRWHCFEERGGQPQILLRGYFDVQS